jgi:hypothetical protein
VVVLLGRSLQGARAEALRRERKIEDVDRGVEATRQLAGQISVEGRAASDVMAAMQVDDVSLGDATVVTSVPAAVRRETSEPPIERRGLSGGGLCGSGVVRHSQRALSQPRLVRLHCREPGVR